MLVGNPSDERFDQDRAVLFRPFRAGTWVVDVFAHPGRCPGLICGCPFGAADNSATSKGADQGRVASCDHAEVRSLRFFRLYFVLHSGTIVLDVSTRW